eukprot:11753801-Alexandrium_andersonii.AAC.1
MSRSDPRIEWHVARASCACLAEHAAGRPGAKPGARCAASQPMSECGGKTQFAHAVQWACAPSSVMMARKWFTTLAGWFHWAV